MLLWLGIGMILGAIITLLAMLVFFVVGYNTLGTLLQVFKPDVFVPTLRQLQDARENDTEKEEK